MVQARYVLTGAVFACYAARGFVVRGARVSWPKLEMRTLSLAQDSTSYFDCMLGLAGNLTGEGDYSTVYALDKTKFLAMQKKYEQDYHATQILNDIGDRMDPIKKYIIKLSYMALEAGRTEFRAQAEASVLGIAPQLAAGWVCDAARKREFGFSIIVMERMGMSLGDLYMHLCEQLTEKNRAEVTRLAALSQRAAFGVLERLAQRGVKHNDAHVHNFMLDADGRVRAIDFGMAVVDKRADAGHEGGKLTSFRESVVRMWKSAEQLLQCLEKQLESANLWRPGSGVVAVGSPDDRELELLGSKTMESLLTEPYGWDTFQPFIDTSLGEEPFIAGLLDKVG